MHKIRNIRDFKFAAPEVADKYDNIYRKCLNLPFDFSLQMISGNNVQLIGELYMEAADAQYENMNVHEYSQSTFRFTYEHKLEEFKDMCHGMHALYDTNLMVENATIFFCMPETMLSIPDQQTFLYDCLMILKKEYDENLDKPFYKHINFFVMTESIFVMSDCFPGNMLLIEGSDEIKESLFVANLYDITVPFTPKMGASIAENVIHECIQLINGENEELMDFDFIGDNFIRNSLKKKQNKKYKN